MNNRYKNGVSHKVKRGFFLWLLIFFAWASLPQHELSAQSFEIPARPIEKKVLSKETDRNENFVKGEVIVKYKKRNIDLSKENGTKKADNFQRAKNLESIDEIKDLNIRLIKTQKTTAQTLEDLKNDSNVEYVQPNFRKYPSITTSNDPLLSQQWSLNKIQATDAWDNENQLDDDITVAVLDTGVYYDHVDLSANMWDGSASCKDDTDTAIQGGCPYHGWDYKDYQDKNGGLGDNNPTTEVWGDFGEHGTMVAGVLAANTNNSTLISGMSRYNHIRIMAVRFGMETFSEVKGIYFAKYNGARIINASFGGPDFDQAEKDAITDFGGIFVAAAGNYASNNDLENNYPSDYDNPNIISVTATDQNDRLASFSNYGPTTVDLSAPGVNIATIDPDSEISCFSVNGTSFSTPLVAGAAALLESKIPTLTISQIKDNIVNSGDSLPYASDASKISSGKRLNLKNSFLAPFTSKKEGRFTQPMNVTLRSSAPDATIYYTTDSSNPSTSSAQYSSPIDISSNTTLKFFATKTGVVDSNVTTFNYSFESSTPVHRFWSDKKQGHFYTSSIEEKDAVMMSDPSWTYEGTSFGAYQSLANDVIPIYRFWSDKKQHHFYTASEAEKAAVIVNDPSWRYETVAYYAYDSELPNTTPVYRFWSDKKQGHFYTTSLDEKAAIEANDPSWEYETIAWYVPTN